MYVASETSNLSKEGKCQDRVYILHKKIKKKK